MFQARTALSWMPRIHTLQRKGLCSFLPCLEPIQHPIQLVPSNPVPGVMMLECKDQLEAWLRMGNAVPTFVYDVFTVCLQAPNFMKVHNQKEKYL